MSAKTVVAKLRDLAAQPQNRAAIVQDQGCLPGLILFLDSPDRAVVVLALEALQYLSLCASNRAVMTTEMGLVVSLNVLIKNGSPEERTLATQIKQNLEGLAPPAHTRPATTASTQTRPTSPARVPFAPKPSSLGPSQTGTSGVALHAGGGFVSKQNFTGLGGIAPSHLPQLPASPPQKSFFVGVANKKAKTFVIQLKDFKDSVSRSLVEEALLSVRGVISFTFDMGSERVSVRVKHELSVDTVFCAILNVNESLAPRQVLKNLQGEEVFLEPTVAQMDRDEENEPQYLEEDDDDLDPERIKRSALARKGQTRKNTTYDDAACSSTSASSGGGWLDGITSFAKSWWG